MRGKASNHATMYINNRITPAYAGKSFVYKSEVQYNEDHPRLCGEKGNFLQFRQHLSGSPPPMRGKAGKIFRRVRPVGITPAYAGKSQCTFTVCGNFWDHPRLCGEKTGTKYMWTLTTGSPPPMRGKVDLISRIVIFFRITPAYAGKSPCLHCILLAL